MINDRKELSGIPQQFGNLVALTKGSESVHLGVPSVFVSSMVQFQPLFEIDLYKRGKKLEIEPLEFEESAMEWHAHFFIPEVRIFLDQRVIVSGDQIALRLEASGDGVMSSGELEVFLTGALLFSPQGIPYHWKKEAEVAFQAQDTKLFMTWRDLRMFIDFPKTPLLTSLFKLSEDDILMDKYFETFNAKPRYRYWVTRKVRERLSSTSAQNANLYSTFSARNTASVSYTHLTLPTKA